MDDLNRMIKESALDEIVAMLVMDVVSEGENMVEASGRVGDELGEPLLVEFVPDTR